MPDYVDWFVDREKQFQGFLKMLARETPKSIMLVEAPADMGKTWLLQKMRHHSGGNGVPVLYVDFRDRRPYDLAGAAGARPNGRGVFQRNLCYCTVFVTLARHTLAV